MSKITAYIGIGSNIEPEHHIERALAELKAHHGAVRTSTLYRVPAVGFAGADFINGVIAIETTAGIEALVDELKNLELAAGRKRSDGMGSRELDLDLLLYGDQVIHRDRLVLPRPDILKYAFVLRPLAELAPETVHPATGETLAWHWAHFQGQPVAMTPVMPALSPTNTV